MVRGGPFRWRSPVQWPDLPSAALRWQLTAGHKSVLRFQRASTIPVRISWIGDRIRSCPEFGPRKSQWPFPSRSEALGYNSNAVCRAYVRSDVAVGRITSRGKPSVQPCSDKGPDLPDAE